MVKTYLNADNEVHKAGRKRLAHCIIATAQRSGKGQSMETIKKSSAWGGVDGVGLLACFLGQWDYYV